MQPRSRRGVLLALAAIVVATAALRFPLLNVPFERDEGEYAYIAWRLGHGELPYRDWVDQKPPAIFWVYRFALALPIKAIPSVHLTAILFSAGSACVLFLLARRFVGEFWAASAGVLLALLSADPSAQGTAANTELFMMFPLLLSQLTFFAAAEATAADGVWLRTAGLMGLTGALIGVATCFKQVAAIQWIFQAILFPVFALGHHRLRKGVLFAGASLAGAGFVWALVAFYFLFHRGLGQLVYNVFTHNLEYVSAIPWKVRFRFCLNTLKLLYGSETLIWLLASIGLVALAVKQRFRELTFLAGWLLTSALGVSASGYFFPHYFQQILPCLALAAVLGTEILQRRPYKSENPGPERRRSLYRVGLAMLLALLPSLSIYPFLFRYSPAEASRKIYPGNLFAEMPEVGRRLASLTSAAERVFIFGSEPEALFYAQRLSATRYIFLFPLYGPYPDVKEKQIATAKEITSTRPGAALYFPLTLFQLPGTEQYFTQWTRSYLQENFRGEAYLTVDSFGAGHLVPVIGGPEPLLPEGQKIMASLLAQKDR